jgi:two-component system alkaline phosphatase synthesis response regulator PhoP
VATRIAIIATGSAVDTAVNAALQEIDGIAIRTSPPEQLTDVLRPAPAIAVLSIGSEAHLSSLPAEVRNHTQCPILAIVPSTLVPSLGPSVPIDDFVVVGATATELRTRVRRLTSTWPSGGDTLSRGDLVIDTDTCEVSLSGVLIELTFREYELLKFLASHPGRVHSREALLNSVWGYDYYGGDRTVDVHVRRLRSKIEDANHTFIDTIRNMGYRFRKNA